MKPICKNCRFAKWERHAASRRLVKGRPGECTAPQAATVGPIADRVSVLRSAIWPDYAKECPVFQPVEKTPPPA
jgi:hypothetical protein